MEITLKRTNAHTMSAFQKNTRSFTEPSAAESDDIIGPGKSLPDLIRRYYGVDSVYGFEGNFPFLDRDNKERSYNPGVEDPFIFRDFSGIQRFKESSLRMISMLMERWKELKLPVVTDKDRKIEIPDSEKLWEGLPHGSDLHNIIKSNIVEIEFITSNIDILKKACIVRGIIPGWWASSYSGKEATEAGHFLPSIRAHVKAIHHIETSSKYKQVREEVSEDLGDPLDTNTGYPHYTSAMDKENNPIGRIGTIELFSGMGTMNYNVKAIFKEADKRSKGTGCEGYPFMIVPIRRLQPGYKWAHIFKPTSLGLMSDHDERGYNSIRIAWMSSYIYNLLLSPLQLEWKAVRKMMPGLFHDGSAKRNRLQKLKGGGSFLSEADYSNYDRFIPINIFMYFVHKYLEGKKNSRYWFELCNTLHHGLPLLWPDYIGLERGRGWIFYPKAIGLLSGVKITSEEGTIVNSIINAQGLIDCGKLSESSLVDYLTQYINHPAGSGDEYYYIQSDDTQHITTSLDDLYLLGNAFRNNVTRAGLRGSLEVGNRFLMRMMDDGRDAPVPARVYQNTVSNEEPVIDALKFCVGLAMRTDGILGHKTFDPFNSGVLRSVKLIEAKLTTDILKSLQDLMQSSSKPVSEAIEYIKLLIAAGEMMMLDGQTSNDVKMRSEYPSRIDFVRKRFLRLLAERELAEIISEGENINKAALDTMIYKLHKERNVPSSQLLLSTMMSGNAAIQSAVSNIEQKEHKFYMYAMKKIGIPFRM